MSVHARAAVAIAAWLTCCVVIGLIAGHWEPFIGTCLGLAGWGAVAWISRG